MTVGNTFSFSALPTTVEELTRLDEYSLKTPYETAALTVLAMHGYTLDKENGIAMINALKGPQELSSYEKQFLKDRLVGKEYLPRSYMQGSSPENGYAPTTPYTITVYENPYSYTEEGYARLLIKSSGADTERPIVLRKKGDQWFLWENLLLPSIRKPAEQDLWA